jgi:FkbM family methyltransferase
MKSAVRTAARQLLFGPLTMLCGDERRRVRVPVLRGAARGLWLELDLLGGGENAYWMGRYDARILRLLAALCRPAWTVWDVGACIGFYSAFFARLVGPAGRVVAFEPHGDNLRRTKVNTALNQCRNVTLMNVAVGAPLERVDFVVSGATTSHVRGAYVGPTATAATCAGGSISVQCVSLDGALEQYGLPAPDLVKMDIEGAEAGALQHCVGLAERIRPIMLLELHNPECDAEAWRFARRFDYSITSAASGRVIERCADVSGTVLLQPRPVN